MPVVKFDNTSIEGLTKGFGVDQVWVLTTVDGNVVKEIGFLEGSVVHKFPGKGKFGYYGIFDSAKIENIRENDLDIEEFNRVWHSTL